MVFHALEAVKEGEKGRSTVVERTQYITRQKFFWIFCKLSLTFSRWVAVYAPGGYQWRPAVGEKVLVLKAGDHQESPCLVGVRQSEQQLEPGGVRLSGGEGQIDLCKDGIRLTGQVWIGEQTLEDYVSAIAREVTLEILGGG